MGGAITSATRIALALELHGLAFVQLFESCTLDAGSVEEQLLTALIPDEAEAPIPHKARDVPDVAVLRCSLLPPISEARQHPAPSLAGADRPSVPHRRQTSLIDSL